MFRALGATFPERHRQVALTYLIRATLPERRGEVARVFIARTHENAPGATSRSDPSRLLPKPEATLPERRGEVAHVFVAQTHENLPGATSRSDPSRLLPKPGATSRSDYWRSLRTYCLLEFISTQGSFGYFIMHVLHFLNLCLNILCKPLGGGLSLS
ncbi:hypothetical protein F2Q69_00063688 [Brassica cretica]|uniref:Uncharacterized protein n=1 Tax=Brassica cretica TaxID=69181 RepID=A0A8S9RLT5_BRACR|nr:hypothetical protein F2Q69_00063688 [Brassica cretica]